MPRLLAALLAAALLAAGPAAANICRSTEAELATMSRGPSPREKQIATRAAWEAHRLRAHMSASGCDRRPFLFLGPQPPAECRGWRAQLGQLQAQAQAAYPPDEGRRRQLMGMLASNNCRGDSEPRSRPLTAGLFDDGARRRGELDSVEIDPPRIESRIRTSSGKPICVRTCDGYFFPLHHRGPQLQEEGDGLCQSLCPGAETKIYFMGQDIETARSAAGEPYSDLDNALRYRKSYDPSCFCRRAGEGPGGPGLVLNPEGLTSGRPFDVVNPPPETEAAPLRGLSQAPEGKPNAALFTREPKAPPSPPPDMEIENLVTADQGETREVKGADGVRRTVRVIGLTPSPGPAAAAAPSAQGRAPGP